MTGSILERVLLMSGPCPAKKFYSTTFQFDYRLLDFAFGGIRSVGFSGHRWLSESRAGVQVLDWRGYV